MARKALKLLLVISMLLSMTGCWDSLNIDDRDIVTSVVVDYKDGEYTFYVEVANIMAKQSVQADAGRSASSSVVKGSGKSFAEARLDLDDNLNKPIFLGAVQALVITKRMAEYGIEEYALRVRQMQEYRKTMDVVVTWDEPEKFLSEEMNNMPLVGFAIEDSLESMKQLGETFHLSLADLLEKESSRNPCFLLSTISSSGGQIRITGYTVFCKGKSIGFIPYKESRGIIYIAASDTHPKFDYVVPYEDQRFTMQVELKSLDITPHYDGTTPGFDISARFKSNSLYPSSCLALSSGVRETLEKWLEQTLCKEIADTLKRSQEFGCDYLTFSQIFRNRYEDVYDKMYWKDEFPKAWFSVNVNVEILDNDTIDYNPRGLGE